MTAKNLSLAKRFDIDKIQQIASNVNYFARQENSRTSEILIQKKIGLFYGLLF